MKKMSKYIDESAFTDSAILGSERTPEYIDAKRYESELRLKTNEKAKIVGPGQDYENGYWTGLTYAGWLLNEMPAADVEPVKRGEWKVEIGYDPKKVVQCSNCRLMNYEPTEYCPHCGAKMQFIGGGEE